MGPLLGFAGMIGTLAFLVLLIVAVVRKRNKKPYVVGIAVAFVVFAVGLAITPGSDPNSVGGPLSSDTSGQEPAQTAKSQTGDFVEPAQTLEQSAEEADNEEPAEYGVGQYLVGKDIQAGLYKVMVVDKVLKMGYVERSKGVSMGFDDILANIILTGDGYVEIKETDVAVKLTGVKISPITLDELEPDIKTEVSDGIFLVGYDIEPGTYKVEVTDTVTKMGYVERSKNVAMDFDDIIANEIFQGSGYVEIKEGDFAVRVQGAKLILQ